MSNIIEIINTKADTLTQKDLPWIVGDLTDHYKNKIELLARKSYGFQANEVSISSFKEQAKNELNNALNTFLFKKEHWKSGRDANPYLLLSLNRLSDRVSQDLNYTKKTNVLICPLCKENSRREFLNKEENLWRCDSCTSNLDFQTDFLKKNKETLSSLQIIDTEAKINSLKIFSRHSRKGYRCPDCHKFIPESANTINGISCPFDNCIFIGNIEFLVVMNHPVSLTQRYDISLSNPVFSNKKRDNDLKLESILEAENIDAEACLDVSDRINQELKILAQVIDDQIVAIKRNNAQSTIIQKLLMYEAYKNMVEKHPEEMVSYLVHQKQGIEFPIQSRIFQEYVKLLENYLPFQLTKGNATIDIVDLTDPGLGLFLGISEYEAVVKNNYKIPNNTREIYTGGRKFKNYGPCFIGRLIDVIDQNTGKSILNSVIEYGFVDITLNENVPIGTPVKVTHFRIPSHYEIGNMTYLQRIRRHVVDKVYFKLNKKKREISK